MNWTGLYRLYLVGGCGRCWLCGGRWDNNRSSSFRVPHHIQMCHKHVGVQFYNEIIGEKLNTLPHTIVMVNWHPLVVILLLLLVCTLFISTVMWGYYNPSIIMSLFRSLLGQWRYLHMPRKHTLIVIVRLPTHHHNRHSDFLLLPNITLIDSIDEEVDLEFTFFDHSSSSSVNRIFGNWYGNFLLATRSQFALELNNQWMRVWSRNSLLIKLISMKWFNKANDLLICWIAAFVWTCRHSSTSSHPPAIYVWIGNIIIVQHWFLTESLLQSASLLYIRLVAYSHTSEETFPSSHKSNHGSRRWWLVR